MDIFFQRPTKMNFITYKIILDLSQGKEGKSPCPRCPSGERLMGFKLAVSSKLIPHPMLPFSYYCSFLVSLLTPPSSVCIYFSDRKYK